MSSKFRQIPAAFGHSRSWRRFALTLLFACLIGGNTVGSATESPLVTRAWPLPLPDRFLTSNFMEYRNGRFHTGLDLKTNSESGYAVLAAEDGWVVRLRASAYGYGRAVYLQGVSGRFFVYAHLERFADQLRHVVRRAQEQNHTYDVDLYLSADRIPVFRGDVVGLSGQSGTSGPHLHFEVRNRAQQPLNPLHCGFAVPDTFPPKIRKVRAIPCASESRIAGGLTAYSIASRQGLSGPLPPLVVRGPFALTAELSDASDIRGHRLMPQEVTVRLDGVTVYHASNDSLAFSQNSQMRLEWLELPGVREKWLYKRSGNDLPGRRGEDWSLRPGSLPVGIHQVEMITRDHAGNLAQVSWELEILALDATWTAREETGSRHQGAAEAAKPAKTETDKQATDSLQWRQDPLRVPLSPTSAGELRWLTPFLVVEEDTTTGARTGHPASAYAGLLGDHFMLVKGDNPEDQGTMLWVGPDSLTAQEVKAAREKQGLEYLGTTLTVQAVDRHNWRLPVVEYPASSVLPDSGSAVGVYRQGGNTTWGHVETPLQAAQTDSGTLWQVPVPAPGRLALFRDIEPPAIGPTKKDRLLVRLQEEDSVAGVTLPRWRWVPVTVSDPGAGVDPTTLRAWLDGRAFVFEPDLIRNRILVELPDDLAAGSHELIVLAGDFAGNSSLRNLTLDCQASP